MKKIIFILLLALMATTGLYAQQISVVSSGGETSLYRTLGEAIQGASDGSVIYLPGGGFTISDDVKITKKLTIIGIGHKSDNDNVDGVTTISGNLTFSQGSHGSALMGCYMTGYVRIGYDVSGSSYTSIGFVNDVVIRYCNLYSIEIASDCQGTVVNQNYIRSTSNIYSPSVFANNVCLSIYSNDKCPGIIKNNVIFYSGGNQIRNVRNSEITNNVFLNSSTSCSNIYSSPNNLVSGNMTFKYMDQEDPIDLTGVDLNDVFVNFNGGAVSPISDFHFKDAYAQYETQVGIYAGTGFNDKQLAPVPFIIAKDVKEQTDASGKLNVKIRVKAGE